MCSILCVSSLWHSEEGAFVKIVTEKIAKYLIWTPFRVHDLSSRSEGGMISTGPYLTSFLQGWHVLLFSSLLRKSGVSGSCDLSREETARPEIPRLQNYREGRWSISILPDRTSYHSFRLGMGERDTSREGYGRRCVKNLGVSVDGNVDSWGSEERAGEKKTVISKARGDRVLWILNHIQRYVRIKKFWFKNIEFHSVRIETTNSSEWSWSQ